MRESYEAPTLRSRIGNPLTQPSSQALLRALDGPRRRLLEAAIEAAEALACPLWLVGGAVRDIALGPTSEHPLRDLDFATGGDPAPLARVLGRLLDAEVHIEVRIEPRFGTASVVLGPTTDGVRADFAALRSERYARPGALPTVRLGASIEDDLARRDFTVNAIALPLTGSGRAPLIDPFGGLADLAARRLRVLHDRSFIDDATRLWRGARFAARLRLRPDGATAALIASGTSALAAISGRRLWSEFALLAAEPRPGTAPRLLDQWGVLRAVHPSLRLDERAMRAMSRRGPCPPELLFALLTASLTAGPRAEVAARFGVPRAAARVVDDAVRLLAASAAADTAGPELLATLEPTSILGRTAALWLDPIRQRPLQRAVRRWQRTRSPLRAEALVALGVGRGPELGAWLAQLRRARYLGTLNSAAEARRLVREQLGTLVGRAGRRATERPAPSHRERWEER